MKHRVLVISAAFPPMMAGEAAHALHLCERFAASGLETHLLTSNREGLQTDYPFTVHARMNKWTWRESHHLKQVITDVRPQSILLIYTGWNYNYHPMVTYAASIAHQVDPAIRFVTQIEYPGASVASRFNFASRWMSKKMRQSYGEQVDYGFGTLLRDSDAVVTMASSHRQEVVERDATVDEKCQVIVPPPLIRMAKDKAFARRQGRALLKVNQDDALLAYMGLIAPGKGIETLLKSFARLDVAKSTQGRLRQAKLVLIGGVVREHLDHVEYAQAMRQLTTDLGLDDRVVWAGEFDFDDTIASTYLHAADLAVLPLDRGIRLNNSTLANVTAHDLPVLTTLPSNEPLEAAFKSDVNMALCQSGNVNEMTRKIEDVFARPLYAAQLQQGSQALHRDCFAWERVLSQTLETLGVFEDYSDVIRAAA